MAEQGAGLDARAVGDGGLPDDVASRKVWQMAGTKARPATVAVWRLRRCALTGASDSRSGTQSSEVTSPGLPEVPRSSSTHSSSRRWTCPDASTRDA
ncbi:hypothetical protein ABWH91_05000 [Phycisphaerales bacterium ac7]